MNELLYDPNGQISGMNARYLLEPTLIHEIAHQWFYGLVGNDQVQEPWIDEGLAQYLTYRYLLESKGSDSASSFARSFFQRWDRVERDAIPIDLEATQYSPQEYSAIIYGRAALLFMELERADDDLQETIAGLVRDSAWGVIDTAALREALQITDPTWGDWFHKSQN